MFDFDKSVEIALKTWYPENHDLHTNSHHPLGKLLGEWGELLDDYMKSLYKPGYIFKPLDELGDIWYYLRILCYQNEHTPKEDSTIVVINRIDSKIALAMSELPVIFFELCHNNVSYLETVTFSLDICFTVLKSISKVYGITLDQLTQSNWQKLKPGSERGDQWSSARTQTNSAV